MEWLPLPKFARAYAFATIRSTARFPQSCAHRTFCLTVICWTGVDDIATMRHWLPQSSEFDRVQWKVNATNLDCTLNRTYRVSTVLHTTVSTKCEYNWPFWIILRHYCLRIIKKSILVALQFFFSLFGLLIITIRIVFHRFDLPSVGTRQL